MQIEKVWFLTISNKINKKQKNKFFGFYVHSEEEMSNNRKFQIRSK